MAKSTAFLEGSADPTPPHLLGARIPREAEFKQLGVGVRIVRKRRAGPVLEGRLERIVGVLLRLPHLPMFAQRATTAALKAMSVALHGVSFIHIEETKLRRLETRVLLVVWGMSRM